MSLPSRPTSPRSRRGHRLAGSLAGCLILLLALTNCGGSDETGSQGPTPVPTTAPISAPTPEPTAAEPTATAAPTLEPTSTAEPTATAEPPPAPTATAAPTTAPTAAPTATTAPTATAVPTATATPTPAPTPASTPTPTPNTGEFDVEVGEDFTISFTLDPGTDRRWELRPTTGSTAMVLIDEVYIAPWGGTTGASGQQHFTFRGVADGTATLRFWYIDPADLPPAPSNSADFKVTVGTGIPGCSGVFEVAIGEEFQINLVSNPSTGYRWELSEAPTPGVVGFVKDEFIAAPNAAPGTPGWQRFTFRGLDNGETALRFWYVRPFDDPPAPTNSAWFEAIVGTGIQGCDGVFEVAAGEIVEIVLESNSTTGYRWELSDAPTPGVVLLVKDEYFPPSSTSTGTGGWQKFTFRGLTTGQTELKFWFVRPFDNPPAATDRAEFKVFVT